MLYQSMQGISIASAITVILLIWLGTLRNPLKAAYLFIKELLTSRTFLVLFFIMVCILLANKYELDLENNLNYHKDFTPWVFSLEGHFVENLQNFFHSSYITPISVFFYVVVFQSLLIASIGVYISDQNKVFVIAICFAIIINYTVAIPFYLFFPVNEVWSYPPSGASFLMLDVFPNFEQQYRPLSGLNNCFPSLHTSISVTLMVLGLRSGNRRLGIITTISAIVIIFSIFYLGIHWLTDMVAGTLLGLLASNLGILFAKLTLKEKGFSMLKQQSKMSDSM
ncbi:phosphatase PAP2 family protein [Paenibacillus sp. KQZ6P-2]|uniref:Phosphatase PAP2 family protein n=1 Tax=Paenibacillus mangrovi TaxID=2931978 RepID=A0A9X1WNF2_9BACL|nr:phosphatase PAP2 family protein [Paenibacillus mangrovi]MCJ8011711.1 phosphatase PAP2 family protein [Paenibacillus mangrovi]